MTDWPVLDVAIGLALVFSAASLLCSTIAEGIATAMKWRAKDLEAWLGNALKGGPAATAGEVQTAKQAVGGFFSNPLIRPLVKSTGRKPSYIPASLFTSVVMDTRAAAAAAATAANSTALADAHAAVAIFERNGLAGDALRKAVESWYDQSMDRVSGWYKRRSHYCLAVLGLTLALVLNIDSVRIVQALWSQPNVRTAVVAQASKVTAASNSDSTGSGATNPLDGTATSLNDLKLLGVPIGWEFKTGDPGDWPHTWRTRGIKLLGVSITMLAVMLGAPFWFDLLGTLVNLRGSGPAPDEHSPKKKKKTTTTF